MPSKQQVTERLRDASTVIDSSELSIALMDEICSTYYPDLSPARAFARLTIEEFRLAPEGGMARQRILGDIIAIVKHQATLEKGRKKPTDQMTESELLEAAMPLLELINGSAAIQGTGAETEEGPWAPERTEEGEARSLPTGLTGGPAVSGPVPSAASEVGGGEAAEPDGRGGDDGDVGSAAGDLFGQRNWTK